MEAEVIQGVIISILVAAVIGYIFYRLRQPVILGYIIAGIIIGPHLGLGWVNNPEAINFSSELGLIALLFMVGLELDIRKIAQSGKVILIAAVAQFVICAGLGFAFFRIPGFSANNHLAIIYLAITFTFSSTMIVVKLLYDKFELDTLPGRITLGVLVIQDVWAILFLAIQPNLDNPQIGVIAFSFLKGIALVGFCFLMRRYVLPRLFAKIAKNPELIVVTALGWCFLVSWFSNDVAGLSRAMGALIAGITLSTLPYREEISDRVTNIRSFFLILFFVSLGLKITTPSLNIFLLSVLASVFLIVSRFISLFFPLLFMKKGIRVSFLVPLNIAQISEFSLVIVAIGVSYGHIDQNIMTIILLTLMITFTASTYMISYSHKLYLFSDRIFKKLGLRDAPVTEAEKPEASGEPVVYPIIFLGFYKIASSLLLAMEEQDASIKDRIKVIDFNPEVCQELNRRGIKCLFGDLGNTGTLTEAGLEKASLVISSIPDTILKGTNNMSILNYIKRVNPAARVVVTAERIHSAEKLWDAGADFVILPQVEMSSKLALVMQKLISEEKTPEICLECHRRLTDYKGVVID
jgi:Kef-type K+ transport system membrane component KefB